MQTLILRECSRLTKDIEKYETERKDAAKRAINLQQQIERGNEKMEQFKMKMNWNQEELDSWALASRQKEEDLEALAKYGRVDDVKMKDLAIAIEKVSKDVSEAQYKLSDEVTETQSAQIQLDKTAEDFKRMHEERLELVRLWEEALETVKYRDTTIQQASERFAVLKAALRDTRGQLAEQERFLKAEQVNNNELDNQVALADREVAYQRDQFAKERGKAEALADHLAILVNTVARVRSDLNKERATNDNLRHEVDQKQRRLQKAVESLGKEAVRLENEMNLLLSVEEKLAKLEELGKTEDERYERLRVETEQLRGTLFKRAEFLKECRERERSLISEIRGGQTQLRNLDARIVALEAQIIKQEELIYNADFQIQVMERKVARAGGERSEDEKRQLNEKIEALTVELEAVNQEHAMLANQVKQAEQELITSKRRHARLKEDSTKFTVNLDSLNLEITETIRAGKQAVKEKEERMVAHDVMRLEVKRLRELLGSRADEVFSLENKKAQLKLSLEERRHEVDVHMEALRAELRMMEDDRHQLALELKEREARVDKLEAKFTVLERKGKGTDENGEELSQAYYVIKAAQEREELQREGDALDIKIQKAEKEVRALEVTLGKLNGTNAAFRGSLRKGDDASFVEEQGELRKKLDTSYDRLKLKRGAEKEVGRDVLALESNLDALKTEEARLVGSITEMGREKQEGDVLIADQEEKAARAERRLESLRRDINHQAGHMHSDPSPLEREVELSDIKDLNRAIVQELRDLAQSHPRTAILEQLGVANVALPSRSGGRSVSGTSSRPLSSTRGGGSGAGPRGALRSQQGSRGIPVASIGL